VVQHNTAELDFGVGTGTFSSCSVVANGGSLTAGTGITFDGYAIGMELGFPGGNVTSPSSYVSQFPTVPNRQLADGSMVNTQYATMGVGTILADGGVTLLASAVSGTVNVTSAGATMGGTFDVRLHIADGGDGTLSGSFDMPLCDPSP
jgi:hypothetical protein